MEFTYKSTTHGPMDEVVAWCEQTLGEFDVAWYRLGRDIAAPNSDPDIYHFDNEQYYMWFKLRWE
jgi:hypothetical protein